MEYVEQRSMGWQCDAMQEINGFGRGKGDEVDAYGIVLCLCLTLLETANGGLYKGNRK